MNLLNIIFTQVNPIIQHGVMSMIKVLQNPVKITQYNSFASQFDDNAPYVNSDILIIEINNLTTNECPDIGALFDIQKKRNFRPFIILTDLQSLPFSIETLITSNISIISRRGSAEEISNQLSQVVNGKPQISPLVTLLPEYKAHSEMNIHFTAMEQSILEGLLNGSSVTQLANQFRRSVKTISTHKRNIMKKVGAETEVEFFTATKCLH